MPDGEREWISTTALASVTWWFTSSENEKRMRNPFTALGSFSAGVAVALGAFGAHGLRETLSPDLLATFETGARYQMYHAFGLMLAGFLVRFAPDSRRPLAAAAGWAFLAGSILFCGSLYLLSLTGMRWIGAITPFGGLVFIAGWVLTGISAIPPKG